MVTGWCLTCRAPRVVPGRQRLAGWVCPTCGSALHGPNAWQVRMIHQSGGSNRDADPWAAAVRREP